MFGEDKKYSFRISCSKGSGETDRNVVESIDASHILTASPQQERFSLFHGPHTECGPSEPHGSPPAYIMPVCPFPVRPSVSSSNHPRQPPNQSQGQFIVHLTGRCHLSERICGPIRITGLSNRPKMRFILLFSPDTVGPPN